MLFHLPEQWFPNFFGSRTTQKNLIVREGQNIDLYMDSRTTSANLADHQWSAEQTLGITVPEFERYKLNTIQFIQDNQRNSRHFCIVCLGIFGHFPQLSLNIFKVGCLRSTILRHTRFMDIEADRNWGGSEGQISHEAIKANIKCEEVRT